MNIRDLSRSINTMFIYNYVDIEDKSFIITEENIGVCYFEL